MKSKLPSLLVLLAAATAALAHPGGGIVVLDDGAVIAGDPVNNRLWRFQASKAPVALLERFHGHWATQGLDGGIYVEAMQESGGAWPSSVFRLRAEVPPLEVAGRDDLGALVFLVDRDGRLVFQRGDAIVRRERTGEIRRLATGEPPLGTVLALAWGPKGTLHVADGDRIRVAGADGKLRTRARLPAAAGEPNPWNQGAGTQVTGLTVDGRGAIFAASPQLGSVLRIEGSSPPRAVTEDAGDGWLPTGVAWKDGSLWVLEHHASLVRGPRVRRIDPGGASTILGVVDATVLGGR